MRPGRRKCKGRRLGDLRGTWTGRQPPAGLAGPRCVRGLPGASPGPGLVHGLLQECLPQRFTSCAVSFITFFKSVGAFVQEVVTKR